MSLWALLRDSDFLQKLTGGGGGTESFKPRPDVLKPEVLMSLSHSSVQGRWLGSVGRWQQARQEWSGSRGAFGRDREEGTIP